MEKSIVQTEKVGNKTINILYDNEPENPRTEWDNLTKMVCFHNRYNLGDKHDYKVGDFDSWVEMERGLIKDGAIIIMPLYLYDHSGLTISTSPFNCRFDSGQVGFITVDRKSILEVTGKKKISKKQIAEFDKYVLNEIKTYDAYLSGEVYGYEVLDENDEQIDSCYGYYSMEQVLDDARSYV